MTSSKNVLLFGRSYILTVGTVQIKNLEIQFVVKKNLKATPNTLDVRIWNLSESNRAALEQVQAVPVQLEAGYKDGGTSVLFTGDCRRVDSGYQDGPDIITVLSSGDSEKKLRTARASKTFKKGAKPAAVVKHLAQTLGVGHGNIDAAMSQIGVTDKNLTAAQKAAAQAGIDSMFSEGTILSGSASREMDRICKGLGLTYSVQNGVLQLLPLRTALDGEAILISSETGMIGLPTVDSKGILKCQILMIPDVFPGRKIVVDSQRIKGQYRIETTVHSGDTYGKDWYINIEGKRY